MTGSITLFLAALAAAPSSHVTASIVFEVADSLGGCAVADVDPDRGGNEIVVTSGKGIVYVLYPGGELPWKSEIVLRSPGEMIQVAAGDADPSRPGNEIVAVGMAEGPESDAGPGAARLVYKEGGAWKSSAIFEEDALVHGVGIGDAGVFVTGYDGMVHLLRPRKGGAFETVSSAAIPGNGKAALAIAGGAWVACTDGSLVKVTAGDDGRLATAVADKRDSGRARLATDGARVLVCDDDGTLSLVGATGRREIFREAGGKKLRGAVLADLDPRSPGLEAATTGYSGKVTVLYPRTEGAAPATEYAPFVLFSDRAGFHHAAAGDLDGLPGDELVVCGLAGRVIVFRF